MIIPNCRLKTSDRLKSLQQDTSSAMETAKPEKFQKPLETLTIIIIIIKKYIFSSGRPKNLCSFPR